MSTIKITDLKKGDLIFSYPHKQGKPVPGIGPDKAYAKHVTMVTGKDDNKVQVTHSVELAPGESQRDPETGRAEQSIKDRTGAYHRVGGHYGSREKGQSFGKYWKGTIRTDLAVDKSQESRSRVVRCVGKPGLAATAVGLAEKWASLEVPYGQNAKAQANESKFVSANELVRDQRKRFSKEGRFRAVTFAARRDSYLFYPKSPDEAGAGMFCSMFVALCYQVAGIEDHVKAESASNVKVRVTDMVLTRDQVRNFKDGRKKGTFIDLSQYKNYVRNLGAMQASTNRPLQYKPSLSYWSSESSLHSFPWDVHITTGMMVDAKFIYPGGLFECLVADTKNWQDMGYVVGQHGYSESHAEKAQRLLTQGRMVDLQRRAFARGDRPDMGFKKK